MTADLQRLLDIPRDLLEEVVVVCCGGCSRGEDPTKALSFSGPRTVGISLQSLATGVEMSCRRIWTAHAVVGIAGCVEDCVSQLLEAIRPCDIVLMAPDIGDSALLAERVEKEVATLCVNPRARLAGELVEIDCSGMRCPQPIVRLGQLVATLAPGEGVRMQCDDPTFRQDVEMWCDQMQQELESVEVDKDMTIVVVRRAAPPTTDAVPGFGTYAEAYTQMVFKLDCLGLKCPSPMIRLAQTAREMVNGRIEVRADDPAFPADVRTWCEQSGSELVSFNEQPDGSFFAVVDLDALQQSTAGEVTELLYEDMSELPLLARLDQRDVRSPLHIVELGKVVQGQTQSGLIEVTTREPNIETDLRNWSERTGARVVKVVRQGNEFIATVAIYIDPLEAAQQARASMLSSVPVPPLSRPTPKETPSLGVSPSAPRKELDCVGLRCPIPILRLNQLARAEPSAVIEVKADDPAFAADLNAWCEQSGAWLISLENNRGRTIAVVTLEGVEQPVAIPLSSPSKSSTVPPSVRRERATPGVSAKWPGQKNPSRSGSNPPTNLPKIAGSKVPESFTVAQEEETPFAPLAVVDAFELDYRGLKCPLPILRLTQDAPQAEGRPIVILADDPAFPADIEAWCGRMGATLVGVEREGSQFKATLHTEGAPDEMVYKHTIGPPPPRSVTGEQSQLALSEPPPAVLRASPSQSSSVAPPSYSLPVLVDCRGMKCPMPILRLTKEVAGIESDIVKIIADDPAFPADLEAWCQVNKEFDLVSSEKRSDGFHAQLRRRT